MTKCGRTVSLRAVVVFRVVDPIACIANTWELEDTVSDIAAGSVKRVIINCTYDRLIQNQSGVDRSLTTRIKKQLEEYGIEVERSYLSDLAPTFCITLEQS